MVSRGKDSNKGDCVSGPDIFISYNRQERAAARLFAESFEQEGFNVWWDAVLHSGETFDEVIEKQLRASKAVVVLWSPRSVASRWVRAEATQADRANKLVPVKIEACDLPIIFELTHTADLVDWKGDRSDCRWESFIIDLRRHVGPAKERAPVEAGAAEPASVEPERPVAPEPEAVAEEPAKQAAKGGNGKALKTSQDELAQALEQFSKTHGSVLLESTHAEDAQTKFFKQSDEFRRNEGDKVHCLRRIHAPPGSEALHVITPSGLKIGRTAPADIVVFEPGVSREHCVVEFAADKLRVMDLNSTNGTYIDNKRIGRAEILPVGSVLRVGNVSFEHELHSRADMEQQGDPIGFSPGAGSRDARIARSS